MPTQGEVRLEQCADGVASHALEAAALGLGEGGVRPVGVRLAPPEGEGLGRASSLAAAGSPDESIARPRAHRSPNSRTSSSVRAALRTYPSSRRMMNRPGEPRGRPGSSALRSRTTCACSDLRALGGASPSHSWSTRRSTVTAAGWAATSMASSRRSLAPGTASKVPPSSRTSSDPRTPHLMTQVSPGHAHAGRQAGRDVRQRRTDGGTTDALTGVGASVVQEGWTSAAYAAVAGDSAKMPRGGGYAQSAIRAGQSSDSNLRMIHLHTRDSNLAHAWPSSMRPTQRATA